MLKGDLRKKQILETAETLFCRDGYEKTSVQDILDVLHLSKGSFYHHYESKEQLLSMICERRAMASAEEEQGKADLKGGIAGVDQVLSAMIPFNGAGLTFLAMILPAFSTPEGHTVRERYQEALKQAFLPLLLTAFESAAAEKEIFCDNAPFTAGVCLDLINDLWGAISDRMISASADAPNDEDSGERLELLEQYRAVLEKILVAPYGSLQLISLADLEQLRTQISLLLRSAGGHASAGA